MDLKIDPNTAFVFDLDDTLFAEIDFLKSAYREIVKVHFQNDPSIFENLLTLFLNNQNPFQYLVESFPGRSPDLKYLVHFYRNHYPNIALYESAAGFLKKIKTGGYKTGLVTDGRSITQRNKIKALGLEEYFDLVIISEEFGSEKPCKNNYRVFEEKIKCSGFVYIGDNPQKDFLAPNKLNWTTICLLDQGRNIHKQNLHLDKDYLPQFKINDFGEIHLI